MKFQIVFLGKVHEAGDRAEAEGAVGKENEGGMKAGRAVEEFRFRAVDGIEGGHEREDSDAEKDRGGEGAEKTKTPPETDDQVGGDDRPGQEGDGFVEIIDGAMFEVESALKHGAGMKEESGEENAIIGPVILAETAAPEKKGIDHAQAVEKHREQKCLSIGKPRHKLRVNQSGLAASHNCGAERELTREAPGEDPEVGKKFIFAFPGVNCHPSCLVD